VFFYIPVNSGSLAHYVASALIMPANLYAKKPTDIQNLRPDMLLLSKLKWTENTNCSIEVLLNEAECDSSKELDDFFFYGRSIPISRIKNIHFTDREQMQITAWNINSSTAFIPERLLVAKSDDEESVHPLKINDTAVPSQNTLSNEKWSKRFDTIAGGFSFMKIATPASDRFPPNYFSTLSFFNDSISKKIRTQETIPAYPPEQLYTALFSNKFSEKWSKWLKYIYGSLSPVEIDKIAKDENIRLEKKKLGLFNLTTLISTAYFSI